MAEFLSLGAGVAVYALVDQKFTQGMLDVRRLDQEIVRQFQVSVILQHTGKVYLRLLGHGELVKALVHIVESLGQLNGTVTAEVEQDHGIAVVNGTGGDTIFTNDEARQILIGIAALFTQCLDGFAGRRIHGAVSHNMDVPAPLYHRPVGFITVHGDGHTAAAGSDAAVEIIVVQLLEDLFQLIDIGQRGSLGNVTAVQKDMGTYFFDAFLLGFFDHGDQVGNVGMNIAIGQKSDEVEFAVVLFQVGNRTLPGIALIDGAGLDALVDQLGSLRIDLSAAKSVMAYFRVAHIGIAGKAYSGAGGFDGGMRPLGHQLVQLRFVSVHNGIAVVFVGPADTVHNDQNDRFTFKFCHRFIPF